MFIVAHLFIAPLLDTYWLRWEVIFSFYTFIRLDRRRVSFVDDEILRFKTRSDSTQWLALIFFRI